MTSKKITLFTACLLVSFNVGADLVKDGFGSISQVRGVSGGANKLTLIQVNEGSELAHSNCPQENWDDGNRVVWAIDESDKHIVSMALASFASGKDVRVLGDSSVTLGSYCQVKQIAVKP